MQTIHKKTKYLGLDVMFYRRLCRGSRVGMYRDFLRPSLIFLNYCCEVVVKKHLLSLVELLVYVTLSRLVNTDSYFVGGFVLFDQGEMFERVGK